MDKQHLRQIQMRARRLEAGAFETWIKVAIRARSPELDFGCHWTLAGDALWTSAPAWRLSWIDDTGDLYAVAGNSVRWNRRDELGQWTTLIEMAAPAPTREQGVAIVFDQTWKTRSDIEAQLKGWATDALMLGSFLVNPEARQLLRERNVKQLAASRWN